MLGVEGGGGGCKPGAVVRVGAKIGSEDWW